MTQTLSSLGSGAPEAAGLNEMHKQQIRAHRTNAAVMHARVFGFEQLSRGPQRSLSTQALQPPPAGVVQVWAIAVGFVPEQRFAPAVQI